MWAVLGALLGPMLAVLGRSWALMGGLELLLGLCARSWVALGAYVGGLGRLLRPLLAVLVRSSALCWGSRATLGAYVGGLGPLLGPMLAILGRDQGEKRPKPGKVAQTRAGAGVGPPEAREAPEAPEAPGPGTYFFCRYIGFLLLFYL